MSDEETIIIRDNKKRPIIKIDESGTMLIGRYVDMSEKYKSLICKIFCEFTGSDSAQTMSFLNFKDDNKENEFCS